MASLVSTREKKEQKKGLPIALATPHPRTHVAAHTSTHAHESVHQSTSSRSNSSGHIRPCETLPDVSAQRCDTRHGHRSRTFHNATKNRGLACHRGHHTPCYSHSMAIRRAMPQQQSPTSSELLHSRAHREQVEPFGLTNSFYRARN